MTNSYRQQTQYPGGTTQGLPDLTVPYPCDPQNVVVCNRGAGTAPPGAAVYEFPGNASKFDPDTSANIKAGPCYTTVPINPGECITVPCPHTGGSTGQWVVNPTCHGSPCTNNSDCQGSSTCNLTTGYCTASCNASIPASPLVQECSDNSGNWSVVHGADNVCEPTPVIDASLVFTRTFTASCPPSTSPSWGLFSYDTSDPVGTNVVFSFQTGDDETSAAAAPSVTVATAGYSPIGSTTQADPQVCKVPSDSGGSVSCPIDLATKITPVYKPVLIMTATLNANTTAVTSPTLNWWNVTYSCPPSE